MKYDFETVIVRKGKDAMAFDAIGSSQGRTLKPTLPKNGLSVIPMWIADMNFATVPAVVERMIKRAQHPIYGYFYTSDEYYDAIIQWHKNRHGVQDLSKNNTGYENGVLGCLSTVINALTLPGDHILLHSPAYVGFSNVIYDTGRIAALSPLVKDENDIWRMDFKDMERQIKENNIHLAIFCSPHNPCGRVWQRWEIEKALHIFKENDVFVFLDEIWADLVFDGHQHIPTYSISDDAKSRTISVYAPSKTFNMAGLIGSYHVIYNKYLNDQITKMSAMTHYNTMNILSMHALIGAYSQEGMQWVDELNSVLYQNVKYVYEFIKEHFQGVEVSMPQGTYMIFLHCEKYCQTHQISLDDLIQKGWDVGVAWQNGRQFYDLWGIRINCALPFSLVKEAMSRLKKYVFIV